MAKIDVVQTYVVHIRDKPSLERPLGINFNSSNAGLVQVKSFAKQSGKKLTFFESHGTNVGDTIVALNDKSVRTKKFSSTQKRLAKYCVSASPVNPVKIEFECCEGEMCAIFTKVNHPGFDVRVDSVGHFYVQSIHSESITHTCVELHTGLILVRINGHCLTGVSSKEGKQTIAVAFENADVTPVNIRFADPSLSRRYTSPETMQEIRRAAKQSSTTSPSSPFGSILMDRTSPDKKMAQSTTASLVQSPSTAGEQSTIGSLSPGKAITFDDLATTKRDAQASPAKPLADHHDSSTKMLANKGSMALTALRTTSVAQWFPGLLEWVPNSARAPPSCPHSMNALPGNVPVTLGMLYLELRNGKRLVKSNMSMKNQFTVVLVCDGQIAQSGINEKPSSNPKWNVTTSFRIFDPNAELVATICNNPSGERVDTEHYTDHAVGQIAV